jgi:hypothetical protein
MIETCCVQADPTLALLTCVQSTNGQGQPDIFREERSLVALFPQYDSYP